MAWEETGKLERFSGLVGMPAAQYLARWRLTVAARLLEDPDLSFAQAGEQVGYQSEAAFQRAFKKYVGPRVAQGAGDAASRRRSSQPSLDGPLDHLRLDVQDGFYAVLQAGADQDPGDTDAFGLAMLIHLKGARFVGADNGGCKLSGTLVARPDGRFAMHLLYELKCGSHLPDGTRLEADRTIEADVVYEANLSDGAPQPVNIGLGPMYVRLSWLADAVT